MPIIAGLLAGLVTLLVFMWIGAFDGSSSTVEWDVCEGHGIVTGIVSAPNNRESTITCEDGSSYKLTLTVLP